MIHNDRDRLDVEALRFLATVHALERAKGSVAEALQAFFQAITDAGDNPTDAQLRQAIWDWWATVPMVDRAAVLKVLAEIFRGGER